MRIGIEERSTRAPSREHVYELEELRVIVDSNAHLMYSYSSLNYNT